MTLYFFKSRKSIIKFIKILIQRCIVTVAEINKVLYLFRKVFDR